MNLDDQDLSALIRQHATRHTAPDALRAGVRTQVALADAGRAASAAAPAVRHRSWRDFGWRTASLGFVFGMAFALLVVPVVQRLDGNEPLDAELVAEHVRALQSGLLAEVVSTDRHTVKPWFQGRLDYAPPVFDLAAEGFPLMGGRTVRSRGHVVATLAYLRDRHVVDLFVWPSTVPQTPQRSVHKGFNVLHWADGSMEYWAVSDVERGELERFAQLWQQRVAAQ